MTSSTPMRLELTRRVKAPIQTVFDAWTLPEHLVRWSSPEGTTVSAAEVDLRVGGTYRIVMLGDNGKTYTATGTYREIDPPHRLVYTWDWVEEENHMGVDTRITVEFTPDGAETVVRMVHEGFPTEALRDAHDQGWTSCLGRLGSIFD